MSDEIVPHEELNPESEGDLPKSKIRGVFEKMEMMALHKGDGIDISALNDGQRDKLMDVLQQNEDHAFQYHAKKLDNDKEVKLAKINASTISVRSNRTIFIVVLVAIFLITLIILLLKDTFLSIWLSFISGIGGGYGLGKFQKSESSS